MYKEEGLTPAEKALECALGQLKPAADRLNRDELMFNAGRAAASGKGPWQMLSGVLTVLLLSSVLIQIGSNEPAEQPSVPVIAQYEMPQAPSRSVQFESGGSLEYVTLRRDVVERGLDALPLRRAVSGGSANKSRRQLLDSMLSS
ncbi:MAG: hypothetical protein ACYSWO_22040 [Planctomycetota bacterium]|jgi:hypothetical protein